MLVKSKEGGEVCAEGAEAALTLEGAVIPIKTGKEETKDITKIINRINSMDINPGDEVDQEEDMGVNIMAINNSKLHLPLPKLAIVRLCACRKTRDIMPKVLRLG